MTKRFRTENGFTLMELMVAVSIVVLMAAIGIPIYLKFQADAEASEAGTNLNGIKLLEKGYQVANGTYLNCAASPRLATALDETAVAWKDLGTGFTEIGFSPSASLRFAYQVSGSTIASFVAEALGDTNADGNRILFVATPNKGPHVIGSDPDDGTLTLALGATTDTKD